MESALFDLKEIVRLDSLNTTSHFNIAEVYFELSKDKNSNPKYPSLVKYHLDKSIKIEAPNTTGYVVSDTVEEQEQALQKVRESEEMKDIFPDIARA